MYEAKYLTVTLLVEGANREEAAARLRAVGAKVDLRAVATRILDTSSDGGGDSLVKPVVVLPVASDSGAACAAAPPETREEGATSASSQREAAQTAGCEEEAVSPSRLAWALRAGKSAREKLDGRVGAVEKSVPLTRRGKGPRQCVVLADGAGSQEPRVLLSWMTARAVVGEAMGHLRPGAVFHSFDSWAECLQYTEGAKVNLASDPASA